MITESDSSQRKKEEKKKAVETGREKVSHLYVSGAMAIDGEYDPA